MRLGAGGVIRNSHHNAGRLARAASAHGIANVIGPRVSTECYRPLLDNAANRASSAGSGG